MINFSIYIRKLRLEQELTQDYMALKLDMSTSSYSKLERGQTDPTLSRVEKIAEILRFDLGDYYAWKAQEGLSDVMHEPDESSNYRYVTLKEFKELQMKVDRLNERMFLLEENS